MLLEPAHKIVALGEHSHPSVSATWRLTLTLAQEDGDLKRNESGSGHPCEISSMMRTLSSRWSDGRRQKFQVVPPRLTDSNGSVVAWSIFLSTREGGKRERPAPDRSGKLRPPGGDLEISGGRPSTILDDGSASSMNFAGVCRSGFFL